jgi:hypothetical protein
MGRKKRDAERPPHHNEDVLGRAADEPAADRVILPLFGWFFSHEIPRAPNRDPASTSAAASAIFSDYTDREVRICLSDRTVMMTLPFRLNDHAL